MIHGTTMELPVGGTLAFAAPEVLLNIRCNEKVPVTRQPCGATRSFPDTLTMSLTCTSTHRMLLTAPEVFLSMHCSAVALRTNACRRSAETALSLRLAESQDMQRATPLCTLMCCVLPSAEHAEALLSMRCSEMGWGSPEVTCRLCHDLLSVHRCAQTRSGFPTSKPLLRWPRLPPLPRPHKCASCRRTCFLLQSSCGQSAPRRCPSEATCEPSG